MSQLQPMRPRFWVRILALLLDYAIILGWMAVLAVAAFIVFAITGDFFDWLSLGTTGAQVLGFLLLVFPVGVYLFVSEASSHHATVGKRALHLRVVDASTDSRPTRSRILVRTIVKLLPWEVAHFVVWNIFGSIAADDVDFPVWLLAMMGIANLLPLGYVAMVAIQKQGRGPHDLIAGTRVIQNSPGGRGSRRTTASGTGD